MPKDASALPLDGFQQPVGEIVPDANGLHCRRTGCTLPGPAVYAMVVGTTVMKIGQATARTTSSTLKTRIGREAGATNYHLDHGTAVMFSGPCQGQPVTEAYKILSPLVIRALKTIIIWAKPWDVTLLSAEEERLRIDYDPPWTGSISPEKTRVTESVCNPISK